MTETSWPESGQGDDKSAETLVIKPSQDEAEYFSKDKLRALLNELSFELDVKHLKIGDLVDAICRLLPARLTLYELFDLISESVASRVVYHSDHSKLAGRIVAKKLQNIVEGNGSKKGYKSFSRNVVNTIQNLKNSKSGKPLNLLSNEFVNVVKENGSYFDLLICSSRDFEFSFFGIKTLEKLYLLKGDSSNNSNDSVNIVETPQYMFLRVAIGIHGNDLDSVRETYDLMSRKYFIHASPTLYNAGSEFSYLSSCFLIAMEDDSIDGIFKTLHTTALVSKASGGIGLHVHNIRGNGSYISSSNGTSSGLIPMLKVFNDTARYVDQGGNKRPGAFAIYLEPWHSDIFEVLNLKKNHGKEELRTRDLFFGLWIPDLFMKRVKEDADWALFSPDEAPGLSEVYGKDFENLYMKYELEKKSTCVVKAQKLWCAIIESQTETGGPYMLYKDSCNKKSNQQNLGVIKSSNLCCEVVEYSSKEETAVCNLGSLALPSFVRRSSDTVSVDLKKLHKVTKILAKNLNKVIDVTKYPVTSAARSNKRHRPIAIGVQGLADLFLELRLPFDSDDAKLVNIQVFETIYHASVEASLELSKLYGPYESFKGSPASRGYLQFDLWDNHKPSTLYHDWDNLKNEVMKHGLRNSLLVAPMPTASTSQILGFNECFEPYTSNIYTRRVLSGEYQVVNKYLLKDLIDLGIWSTAIKDKIILENGSIQGIAGIPVEIKKLYKTVWEISQRTIIDMAADRAKFIDQLQSMNIHMKDPTMGKLTSCHFYGWEKGLKTGMYYLRTQAASRAIQFTVNHEEIENIKSKQVSVLKRNRYEMVNNIDDVDNEDAEDNLPLSKKGKSEFSYGTPTSQTPKEEENEGEYDIHDTTPLACDIVNPGNCESCSG